MCRSSDTIELVQVVGHYPHIHQPLAQLNQPVDRVIHSSQQDGLIQHGDSCIEQPAHGPVYGGVEFGGMVGMDHHDGRQSAVSEQSYKRLRNSLRNDDGQPGVDAQPLQMFDFREAFHELIEPLIGHHQRISAAENHFLDVRVVGQLIESRLPIWQRARC